MLFEHTTCVLSIKCRFLIAFGIVCCLSIPLVYPQSYVVESGDLVLKTLTGLMLLALTLEPKTQLGVMLESMWLAKKLAKKVGDSLGDSVGVDDVGNEALFFFWGGGVFFGV